LIDDTLDAEQTTFTTTLTLLDQDDYGTGWDIGADIYTGGAVIEDPTGWIQTGYSTEANVRSIAGSLAITLTNATWDATIGADNALTTALIAGIDSNRSESTGWNAVVKVSLDYTNVTRTSDRIVTIAIDAQPTYDITTTETITVTIPASCTNAGIAIVCPHFYISALRVSIPTTGVIGSRGSGNLLRSSTGPTLYQRQQ
jgi:hypothetical protein